MPESQLRPTTGVSRRHLLDTSDLGFITRFGAGQMEPEPVRVATSPRPFGDLGEASIDHIATLAATTWKGTYVTNRQRAQVARLNLEYLSDFPGHNWQQRWEASPLGRAEIGAAALDDHRVHGMGRAAGVRTLFCLRIIRPSLAAFRRHTFGSYPEFFIAAQQDPLLNKYAEQVEAHPIAHKYRRTALIDMCTLLTVHDAALSDITAPNLVYFAHENRRTIAALFPERSDANKIIGRAAWDVLVAMGHFPPDTPTSLRAAMVRGQQSVEELVDQYPIRNRAVRQLLIDYFTRRRADADYATLKQLVWALAHQFWHGIEQINPEQADLHISEEVYAAWRQMISTRKDGRPRAGADGIVINVRSFYFDLHTWAAEEPHTWAIWVAPCPVPPSELRGLGKRRRRINDRTADRTRQRQPLLPILVEHVESRYDHTRTLLAMASKVSDGEIFSHQGRTYSRYLNENDRKNIRHGPVPVRVLDQEAGTIVHVSAEEESAFWEWAFVETLRHSGARIEEVLELTHLSVRQYQRPNGEVIALLVIAPSKTDRERVIPMSPELFHVIASVIRRHASQGRPIPLTSRYDRHDKVWSAPMPFLFQRTNGATAAVFSATAVQAMLRRRCEEIAKDRPAFRELTFTPHDFRRIFATELVNSGLPIHIGAALLGHLSVQTTRGYVAVFDEDVVSHYQAHIHQRRQERSDGEYREVTPEEWTEFEEHFDKRKVELGSCGRPYGTPCQHEHACVRCPMLHVSPKMMARLDELEEDLLNRRQRAVSEGWAGEIEGLDLTLTFLRDKREETRRRTKRPTVDLGIPTARPRYQGRAN